MAKVNDVLERWRQTNPRVVGFLHCGEVRDLDDRALVLEVCGVAQLRESHLTVECDSPFPRDFRVPVESVRVAGIDNGRNAVVAYAPGETLFLMEATPQRSVLHETPAAHGDTSHNQHASGRNSL